MREALADAKRDHCPEALILPTRELRRGGRLHAEDEVVSILDATAHRDAVDDRGRETELSRGGERCLVEGKPCGLEHGHVFDVTVRVYRDGEHDGRGTAALTLRFGVGSFDELLELGRSTRRARRRCRRLCRAGRRDALSEEDEYREQCRE